MKAAYVLIYILGVAAVDGALPASLALAGPIAGLLLTAHAIEARLFFRVVRRYPGSLASSLV